MAEAFILRSLSVTFAFSFKRVKQFINTVLSDGALTQ